MAKNLAEIPTENPLLSGQGLSQEQQDEYVAMRRAEKGLKESIRDYRPNPKLPPGQMLMDAESLDKKLAAAYHQDEGAFAVQAVKDAAAEGVHTTFGSSSEK